MLLQRIRGLLVVLLILVPWTIQSQDLSGGWTGYLKDSSNGWEQKLSLNVGSHDSVIRGVLHLLLLSDNHYINYSVTGIYSENNSRLWLLQDQAVPANSPVKSLSSLGILRLHLIKALGKETLEGYGYAENGSIMMIKLERKTGQFIPIPLFTKHKQAADSLGSIVNNDFINNRKSVVAAIIPVREDSVKVSLFDNGTVDGDSISLYMNNTLLLNHLKLAENAKVLYVHINKLLPINKLVLVAENLGTMPPNTALMEVTTDQTTYNVYLSSDYSKNAMVEFVLSSSRQD